MFYNLTNRDGATTLSVVFTDGSAEAIPASHSAFAQILEHLTTDEHDEERVRRLATPALHLADTLAEITDRLVYEHNNLVFDGSPLDNALGDHILAKMEAGDEDYARLVRFLENLSENPSYRCQQAVYEWVAKHGLQITEDGRFVGYKGVQNDGTSSHAGPDCLVDGVPVANPGVSVHVPNPVGSVVSIPRFKCDDGSAACSVGLHVGTYGYAQGFAERLLTVVVNPRDVVSIPNDSDSGWKFRTCEYEVLEIAPEVAYEGTSFDYEDEDDYLDQEDVEEQREQERAEEPVVFGTVVEMTPESFENVVEPVLAPTATLAENASLSADLWRDLQNPAIGHKTLAKKWASITTESSVRRYRKANGIHINLRAKVTG